MVISQVRRTVFHEDGQIFSNLNFLSLDLSFSPSFLSVLNHTQLNQYLLQTPRDYLLLLYQRSRIHKASRFDVN